MSHQVFSVLDGIFIFLYKEVLKFNFGTKIKRLEVGRLGNVFKSPLQLLVLIGVSNFIFVFLVDLLNMGKDLISRWSLMTQECYHER